MKILFLSDNLPYNRPGGAEVVADNLAHALQKAGHQVYITTTVQKKPYQKIIELENNFTIYQIYTNFHPRWRAWLSLYNPQTVAKVKKIIKKIKPDVVHIHNIHSYLSYYCLKIANQYSQAVFLTAHDMMLLHYEKLMPKNGKCIRRLTIMEQIRSAKKRYNPFRNLIINHYLKYVNKIFTISNFLKDFLAVNNINNTATIHNGIELKNWTVDLTEVEQFRKKFNLQNKKIILFGGRLSGAKGRDVILQILSLVIKEVPEAFLLIAGKLDNYNQQKINKILATLPSKVKDHIQITGWLTRSEMKKAFAVADVCVTPSIYCDPFNLFNIEAGATKKPVVGTCFGGTSEIIIDEQTGYIVNPLDIKFTAKRIIDLLTNDDKANRLGLAGYQQIKEKFSFTEQVEKTLEWYKKYLHSLKKIPGSKEKNNL